LTLIGVSLTHLYSYVLIYKLLAGQFRRLCQGQLYEDGEQIKNIDGVTTIPPLPYGHDEVVVFDQSEQKWSVKTISNRPLKIGSI